ncbi:MAG: hypothetical protein ABFD47_13005 [Armatimonadota bacterium]
MGYEDISYAGKNARQDGSGAGIPSTIIASFLQYRWLPENGFGLSTLYPPLSTNKGAHICYSTKAAGIFKDTGR